MRSPKLSATSCILFGNLRQSPSTSQLSLMSLQTSLKRLPRPSGVSVQGCTGRNFGSDSAGRVNPHVGQGRSDFYGVRSDCAGRVDPHVGQGRSDFYGVRSDFAGRRLGSQPACRTGISDCRHVRDFKILNAYSTGRGGGRWPARVPWQHCTGCP